MYFGEGGEKVGAGSRLGGSNESVAARERRAHDALILDRCGHFELHHRLEQRPRAFLHHLPHRAFASRLERHLRRVNCVRCAVLQPDLDARHLKIR